MYKDVRELSDDELDREIIRLERVESDRVEAMSVLIIRLLDRVKLLEQAVYVGSNAHG